MFLIKKQFYNLAISGPQRTVCDPFNTNARNVNVDNKEQEDNLLIKFIYRMVKLCACRSDVFYSFVKVLIS